MTEFRQKKILSDKEQVAEELREARLARAVSLEKAAQATGINKKYLQTMEQAEFEKLPAGVYQKNFLREYARWLGVELEKYARVFNESDFLQDLKQENSKQKTVNPSARLPSGLSLRVEDRAGRKQFNVSQSKQKAFLGQVTKWRQFVSFPKVARGILIITVVLICFIYLGFYLKKLASPPFLQVSEPRDNITIQENFINILGSTEPETEVSINGEPVLTDKLGTFLKTVDLKSGLNIITITAQKRHGKETTIVRQILVK